MTIPGSAFKRISWEGNPPPGSAHCHSTSFMSQGPASLDLRFPAFKRCVCPPPIEPRLPTNTIAILKDEPISPKSEKQEEDIAQKNPLSKVDSMRKQFSQSVRTPFGVVRARRLKGLQPIAAIVIRFSNQRVYIYGGKD